MKNYKNRKRNSVLTDNSMTNQQKALYGIINYFVKELKCSEKIMPSPIGGNCIWFENKKFDLVITITHGYDNKECVKLEEVIVNPKYRNKGILKEIIYALKKICDIPNAKLGLWVKKDNDKLLEFYQREGFILKETIDDHWLEYN